MVIDIELDLTSMYRPEELIYWAMLREGLPTTQEMGSRLFAFSPFSDGRGVQQA